MREISNGTDGSLRIMTSALGNLIIMWKDPRERKIDTFIRVQKDEVQNLIDTIALETNLDVTIKKVE
jgi:hypothetical protein